jgi:hypothetical protein
LASRGRSGIRRLKERQTIANRLLLDFKKAAQPAAAPSIPALGNNREQVRDFSYASGKGFVIRSPLANICIAHSSVAQR